MINFFSVKKKSIKQINGEEKQARSTTAAAAALPDSGQSSNVITIDEDDE
jgi:hypothetical protein